MGQRFQVYVRYNGGENLFAMHLQWSWGKYSIQRAAQLLDFLKKDASQSYSFFLKENFDMKNKGMREDYRILSALTQLNLRDGSYVGGIDLVEEASTYDEFESTDYVRIDPFNQDNNDGFLVIDVIEGGVDGAQIKYCFDMCEGKFSPISANRYFEKYEESEFDGCSEWDSDDAAYYQNLEKSLTFIEGFELLSVAELENIFSGVYLKDKNLVK